MKLKTLFTLCLSALLFGCSTNSGLIKNKNTKENVAKRIAERSWLPERKLAVTPEQKEAMDFIYAYMPMGDAGEYSEELFLSNVKSTLKAKQEMPWSATIPEELFLHFVLPLRVNNEALDTSRVVFYEELKERVKGKSMYDAILEVNHWCHEKAVYTPSDSRTSAAGATVKSAFGRCGEESTFAVAALRSVGIPARQIYVPRWAHTDDNHAWVEAWADGKWYYLGACEPEPVLNKGWFDSPAKRSLLMFTKVFGDYNGTEEVIGQTDTYTEINVTANYAPVKTFVTLVLDKQGQPVENAEVLYNIYNYAEQYPAVRKSTDVNGVVSFTAGLGDITVWAKSADSYGFAKEDLRVNDTLKVVLDKGEKEFYTYTLDIVPPVELPVEGAVTAEQRAENDRRFAQEDSIRNAYVATFMTPADAEKLAAEKGVDKEMMVKFIKSSRGNHDQIAAFIRNTPAEQVAVAMQLLGVISEKDLRDTPQSVLRDHLDGAWQYRDKPFFVEYILNPRVDDELLTPYRVVLSALADNTSMPRHGFDTLNPAHIPITPLAVHRLQMADRASYERYMIALNRSHGVAARREPLTERPQYFDGTQWKYITLPSEMMTVKEEQPKGLLNVVLPKEAKPLTDDPKYYTHFSIAKLLNGEFQTLDMSQSVAADMGEGVSYKNLFNKPLALEIGTYQLITGTRMADGTVLVQAVVFGIAKDSVSTIEMKLRKSEDKLQVIGNIDPEALYIPQNTSTPSSVLSTTGRGYFVLALMDAKKEPTTHMLRGMEAIKGELEAWGRPIVMILPNKTQFDNFKPTEFPELPKTVSYGYDNGTKIADMLHSMLKLPASVELPILVVADSFGRVVYISTGYNTSLGQQLKKTIQEL